MSSIFLGQAVLAMVNFHFGDDHRELTVEAYVNGREQGFHVRNIETQRAVSFSEKIGSDNIVVYYGTTSWNDFVPQGNCPSDNIYKTQRRTFKYSEVNEAAEFIKEHLTTV